MATHATAALSLLVASLHRARPAALAAAAALSVAALAPAAQAQTAIYTSVLSGANEVPANGSAGTGTARLEVHTVTRAWTLTGSYSGLSGNASAAHIHMAVAGVNGGVVTGLTQTGGTSGTLSGSGTFTATQYTTLQSNGFYVNLHSTAFGGGELRDQLRPASVTVNGSCDEPAYVTLATVDNSVVNNGFGDLNDLGALKYYADGSNLYVCAAGEVEANGNGMYFFLNFSNYDGIDGGTVLPSGGPGPFSGLNDVTLDTGFEADWMFFFNRANTNKIYTNVARLGSSAFLANPNGDYLGEATENAAAISFNGNVVSEGGTGTGQIAYQTGYDATTAPNKGYEIMIPVSAFAGVSPQAFSEIAQAAAAGVMADDQLSLFSIISGGGAYLSNEMLPDLNLIGTGDGGGNFAAGPTDFAALTPASSLFTASQALPVELVAFAATASGTSARLSWTTASETNNQGFVVEHLAGGLWTAVSGLVPGRGTTTERTDYAYTVDGLTAGRHTFRLRQIDTDGTVSLSPTAAVEIGVDGEGRVTLLGQRAVRIETGAPERVSVAVYDVMGRTVASQHADVDGTAVVELPTGLAAGSYLVRVQGERFAETRRFIVQAAASAGHHH